MHYVGWDKRQRRPTIQTGGTPAPAHHSVNLVGLRSAGPTLGCAKVVVFEPVDLSGFSSTFEQNRFAKFLLPRNRGRRWPTGRMRGSAGLTMCEQSPPHPALSPNSFAAKLHHYGVCRHANELGERGHVVVVPDGTNPGQRWTCRMLLFAQPSPTLQIRKLASRDACHGSGSTTPDLADFSRASQTCCVCSDRVNQSWLTFPDRINRQNASTRQRSMGG